jgi:hypothetical protein
MLRIKQWLIHLDSWVRNFPIGDYHCYVSAVGGDTETCLVCDDTIPKDTESLDDDSRLLRNACDKCGQIIWNDEKGITMATRCNIKIVGGSGGPGKNSVPVYRDGNQKVWAVPGPNYGAQLMLANSVSGWAYIPESLSAAEYKYYISLRDGKPYYWRIFEPVGDPRMIGAPAQELWVEYSHLERVAATAPSIGVTDAQALDALKLLITWAKQA